MSDHPDHSVELALLRQTVSQMEEDMKGMRAEVKGLVDAWNTATNVLAFIKWLAGIGAAAAFLWAGVKGKFGV